MEKKMSVYDNLATNFFKNNDFGFEFIQDSLPGESICLRHNSITYGILTFRQLRRGGGGGGGWPGSRKQGYS